MLVGAGDKQGTDHPEDRDTVGENGRQLAPDVVRYRAGEDCAGDGEEAAHAKHPGAVELVEPYIHGKGELVPRNQETAEPGEQVDREEQPEMRRTHRFG